MQRNNLTVNDNINRNRSLSHDDLKKLSGAGYHLGRIGYPASSSKFSCNSSMNNSLRSSYESLCSDNHNGKNNDEPMFYLGVKNNNNSNDRTPSPEGNYHNINVPHVIVEEDENSSTIHSINDIKLKTFNRV